jgi:UDP-GlcNAc:undecaprenyl-phosphate/decaprenyl-phosphate GlcNAc-1-phosphate transferase
MIHNFYGIAYLVLFLFIIAINYLLTNFIRKIAIKFYVVDDPKVAPELKQQSTAIPLLGGWSFTGTSFVLCGAAFALRSVLGLGDLLSLNDGVPNLWFIGIAILILTVNGYIDDKYRLPAKFMFLPILLALLVAIVPGNLVISSLSYPFDTFLPEWDILPYMLSFVWLGCCLAATKFLDGHDGIVTSVGIIALLSICAVSLFGSVFQPIVSVFCIIWIGGLLGFLPFNFPNAKMYLGEGGSEVIGFVIGVLAIISGAKIATATTVIGWFILDMLLVFSIRLALRKNPLKGDRLHWHFRLYDSGLSKVQVLVLTSGLLLLTSQLGLHLTTAQKPFIFVFELIVLVGMFLITAITLQLKKRTS